jgi:hypothetical protein
MLEASIPVSTLRYVASMRDEEEREFLEEFIREVIEEAAPKAVGGRHEAPNVLAERAARSSTSSTRDKLANQIRR